MGKRPKQIDLIEDREISELQKLAEEYAGIRDDRQELTRREVNLKDRLLSAMHRHKKTHYKYQDVEITIVKDETEDVKVKIKKAKEDKEE